MSMDKLNDRLCRVILIAGMAIVIVVFSGLVAAALFEVIKPAL